MGKILHTYMGSDVPVRFRLPDPNLTRTVKTVRFLCKTL